MVEQVITHYLVDYENVGLKGLEYISRIGKDDQIHVFSSQNTQKISMNDLAKLQLEHFMIHNVPSGRETLDKHLLTYLGCLIGLNNAGHRYIIVSKDKGFDSVIQSLKKEQKVDVRRQAPKQAAAAGATEKKAVTVKTTVQKAAPKPTEKKPVTVKTTVQKPALKPTEKKPVTVKTTVQKAAPKPTEKKNAPAAKPAQKKAVPKPVEKKSAPATKAAPQKPAPAEGDKRKRQVSSYFGQHFKEKKYRDKKDAIVQAVMAGKTRSQVNVQLQKAFPNDDVKVIYGRLKPLMGDMPGK